MWSLRYAASFPSLLAMLSLRQRISIFIAQNTAYSKNVVAMGQKGKKRDDDVCSQLICAIVGMGYQLSAFFIDAWNFGSPQSRSRIFVAFAAPGYEPIHQPELSHSHPPKTRNGSIGELANREPFGERRFGLTPLKFLTVRPRCCIPPEEDANHLHVRAFEV
jgi:hypothetical protein